MGKFKVKASEENAYEKQNLDFLGSALDQIMEISQLDNRPVPSNLVSTRGYKYGPSPEQAFENLVRDSYVFDEAINELEEPHVVQGDETEIIQARLQDMDTDLD